MFVGFRRFSTTVYLWWMGHESNNPSRTSLSRKPDVCKPQTSFLMWKGYDITGATTFVAFQETAVTVQEKSRDSEWLQSNSGYNSSKFGGLAAYLSRDRPLKSASCQNPDSPCQIRWFLEAFPTQLHSKLKTRQLLLSDKTSEV